MTAPDDDEPYEDDEPKAVARAPRPAWSYFVMPGAIVLGALIIAGAVLVTQRGDDSTPASTAPRADVTVVGSTSRPANLLAAFVAYAKAVGINEQTFQTCLGSEADGAIILRQLKRGQDLGIFATPTFFVNNKRISGNQPRAIFEEVINAELNGSPTSLSAYSQDVRDLAAQDRFAITSTKLDVSDAVIQGSPQAKVMVAEFSDFQCPFCQRWEIDTLGWLRSRLGNDVAFAFLHMPITQIHPNAGYAALASVCAGNQGKFWQMHDLLFTRQQEWQSLPPN